MPSRAITTAQITNTSLGRPEPRPRPAAARSTPPTSAVLAGVTSPPLRLGSHATRRPPSALAVPGQQTAGRKGPRRAAPPSTTPARRRAASTGGTAPPPNPPRAAGTMRTASGPKIRGRSTQVSQRASLNVRTGRPTNPGQHAWKTQDPGRILPLLTRPTTNVGPGGTSTRMLILQTITPPGRTGPAQNSPRSRPTGPRRPTGTAGTPCTRTISRTPQPAATKAWLSWAISRTGLRESRAVCHLPASNSSTWRRMGLPGPKSSAASSLRRSAMPLIAQNQWPRRHRMCWSAQRRSACRRSGSRPDRMWPQRFRCIRRYPRDPWPNWPWSWV